MLGVVFLAMPECRRSSSVDGSAKYKGVFISGNTVKPYFLAPQSPVRGNSVALSVSLSVSLSMRNVIVTEVPAISVAELLVFFACCVHSSPAPHAHVSEGPSISLRLRSRSLTSIAHFARATTPRLGGLEELGMELVQDLFIDFSCLDSCFCLFPSVLSALVILV
jgi:hypothetical protein